jgi:hypothetical protein
VLVLAVGVGALATIVYERGIAFRQEAEPRQGSTQERTQTNTSPEEYVSSVANIQNGAVETLVDMHNRLLRYDSLTASDVQAIEADYRTLGDYSDQVSNLSPPEEYKNQYELFSTSISELYTAAQIGYRIANDPASATATDFQQYDSQLDKATANLKQSNEILGRNDRTPEGLRKLLSL